MQTLNSVVLNRLPEEVRSTFLDLQSRVQTEPGAPNTIREIRRFLSGLKNATLAHEFPSPDEEILFFKITKPIYHSLLVFSLAVFEMELLNPLGGKKMEERFLRKQLRKLHWFFEQHAMLFAYYRSEENSLDHQYFMRKKQVLGEDLFSYSLEVDHSYATQKDRLVAKMLGYERLQEYIELQLAKRKHSPNLSTKTNSKPPLQWTASKASLVELIYALQSSGVYNHGQSELKTIAETFQQLFQVDLGNYYGVFNEIRLRKKNRTSLLDEMRQKILARMDELDEN